MGSSAIPTLRKPREDVQTGGFGDPNGVPANAAAGHRAEHRRKGGYDMPAGPGSGNGTGGAKGAKGVVASSGFGNGVATGSGRSGGHGAVRQGGFCRRSYGRTDAETEAGSRFHGKDKPVEILFKPKPAYTDEARSKKIEGDVLLQVVFTAGGDIQIQRVVQGLGYGLDDSAQAAAKQIRFKPGRTRGPRSGFSGHRPHHFCIGLLRRKRGKGRCARRKKFIVALLLLGGASRDRFCAIRYTDSRSNSAASRQHHGRAGDDG